MPEIADKYSSLYRRKIEKIVGGAVVDWNCGPVLKKMERAITKVNKRGALRVKRKARGMVKQRAYKSGALMSSINMMPSKYQDTDWLVKAGGDTADYVMHVETGRYFKDTNTRVAAVPFMRTAAASTRKWLRPRMKAALQRAIR